MKAAPAHVPAQRSEQRERLQRRELHSPRSVASIVAATVVTIATVYFMFEAVLTATGHEAWIRSLGDWWAWAAGMPSSTTPVVLVSASLLTLGLGLYFLLQGLLPGRRARYPMPDPRAVVVVDKGVLAASLARRARMAASVTAEQVMVVLSRGLVEVQVRPTSGVPVDAAAVRDAVEHELDLNHVDPLPAVKVHVAATGVVGQ